jgi:hypothetical protein
MDAWTVQFPLCNQRALIALAVSLLAACGGGEGDDDSSGGDGGAIDAPDVDGAAIDAALPRFSFFVTSLATMRSQSGSQDGFGGDLGGLTGADQICQTAAAAVGAGGKTWRAFLSVYNNGTPQHAIDRIGPGPWYDRNERLIAMNLAGLTSGNRPAGDAATVSDLPDENGTPLTTLGDSHDILTGSNASGRFDGASANNTCQDWTDAGPGVPNAVRLGHSWPAQSGQHWIRAHQTRGCSPGVNLVQNGPGTGTSVGAGGGWGGIYCFALEP